MAYNRSKLVVINTYAGVFLRCSTLLMQFVIRSVLLSTLNDQYTGISSLFTSILSVLSLAELGIGSAITFALYRPLSEKNYPRIAALMNFYKHAYCLVAGIVFGLGLCFIPLLPMIVNGVSAIHENLIFLYMMYLIQSASSYLLIYKSVLLSASQKNYVISFVDMIINILKMIVESVLLFLFRAFVPYLIFEVSSTILRNLVISKIADNTYQELASYKKERLDVDERRSLMKNVGALSLYSVANVVLNGTDNIIISMFLGTASVTLITNYKMIINGVDGFIWYFYGALNPGAGDYALTHSRNEQYELFKKAEFVAFCFTSISAINLVFLLDLFVGDIWLTPSYVLPFSITLILIADYYMNNMLRPVSVFRNANGLFIQGKFRPLLMAVLNIVLSIVMGYRMGIFGVLFATLLSRFLTQFWFDPLVIYRHVFQRQLHEYFLCYTKYLFVFLLDFAVVFLIRECITIANSIVKFGVVVIIGSGISILMIVLFYRRTKEFYYIREKVITHLRH